MSGSMASWFKRNVLFRTPLYRQEACGNFHPVWDRLCFCEVNEHRGSWHGGIRDLKTGDEYVPYRLYADLATSASVAIHAMRTTFREPPAFVDRPADRIAVEAQKVPAGDLASCPEGRDQATREPDGAARGWDAMRGSVYANVGMACSGGDEGENIR